MQPHAMIDFNYNINIYKLSVRVIIVLYLFYTMHHLYSFRFNH